METFSDSDDAAGAEPKRRRKVLRWSKEEVELLINLTAELGEGQWALIKKKAGEAFHRRTQVSGGLR
jgi:hypothetical protein